MSFFRLRDCDHSLPYPPSSNALIQQLSTMSITYSAVSCKFLLQNHPRCSISCFYCQIVIDFGFRCFSQGHIFRGFHLKVYLSLFRAYPGGNFSIPSLFLVSGSLLLFRSVSFSSRYHPIRLLLVLVLTIKRPFFVASCMKSLCNSLRM